MMVGIGRNTVLVSLLWGIFEIFCNNYNKKEDFHESSVKEWTFCSPLGGKWSDGGGLRAQNVFSKEQISSLECTGTEVFRDSVWESLASFWILTLSYPRRQRSVPGGLIFWRWALAPSKGRRTGFLSRERLGQSLVSALAKWPQYRLVVQPIMYILPKGTAQPQLHF